MVNEEMTTVVENLVNSRIADELEEWKKDWQRERLAEKETEQEAQLDKTNEASHTGNTGLSTWMVAVDKAITRLEDNQLRTDRNMDRIHGPIQVRIGKDPNRAPVGMANRAIGAPSRLLMES
ncbi:hypothetical protein BDR26DRAFT_942955 [Obelidium mucronatum]|nr:hypothetical protein BDR26DRAFT_942955 [Obelidium mucronatum]